VRRIAEKIEEILHRPLALKMAETEGFLEGGLSLSWGWSLFPEEGHTADELLRTADARMYEAKRSRRAAAL
jgi:GGDEF domain-containing protein